MKQRTIIVAGGTVAGPAAALRAREVDEHARIILIERGNRVSYAACGLAAHLSGEVRSLDELDRDCANNFSADRRIEVNTLTELHTIDPAKRAIQITKDGQTEVLTYDVLIYALGASSRMPENTAAENLFCFRTLDDLAGIQKCLDAGAKRVVILGGGVMGVEAADALIRRGLEVTIVEREKQLLPRVGAPLAAAIRKELEAKSRIHLKDFVTDFQINANRIAGMKLSSGAQLEADLVIATLGLVPRTEIIKRAGAKLARDGTVLVDKFARTSLPGVYACGICASTRQVFTKRPVWWPQAALADKSAQVAGANAAGAKCRLAPALGTLLLRVLTRTAGRTGLTHAELRKEIGIKRAHATSIVAPSHERYMNQSSPVSVQLFWNRKSGKVLGVEASGASGVEKCIDAAAAAIAGGLKVSELASLDFSYSPFYGAPRNPLNAACAAAMLEAAGKTLVKD